MPVPAEYALLIDVSKWQTAVDYLLWANSGVECVIGKMSQGSYLQDVQRLVHCAGSLRAGMKFAGYHWADPMSGDQAQLDNFLKASDGLPLEFICIDVEQYWSDWSEYYAKHVTKFIDPKRVSDNAEFLCERLKERTGLRIVVYTRPWFVIEHSQPMYKWIDLFPHWWANYTTDQVDLHTTWDNVKQAWLPMKANPSFPPQYKAGHAWDIWQWSGDKFILPGCKTCLDMNYIKRSFLGQTVPPTPPEPPPVILPDEIVVNTAGLNIRSSPGGTIIGTTSIGKVMQVEGSETVSGGNIWYKVSAYVAGWLTKPK